MFIATILSFINLGLLTTSCYILFTQKYPRITNIGWLVAIIFIPIVGSLSFYFFRMRQKGNYYCSRQKKIKITQNNLNKEAGFIPKEYQKLHDIGIGSYLTYYDQNTLDFKIQEDDSFIEDLLSKIDQAQHVICIVQYIFGGNLAEQVMDALTKAHNRGVKVFLLIDRVGSGLQNPFSPILRKIKKLPFKFSIAWRRGLDKVKFNIG